MFLIGVTREYTDTDDISTKIRILSLIVFLFIPLYIFSICIFYGIWRSNGFNIFTQDEVTVCDRIPAEYDSHDSNSELNNRRQPDQKEIREKR